MTTPADELRAAAQRLRQRADKAERGMAAAVTEGMRDLFGKAAPDPAVMHPPVGRALADWLTHAADTLHTGRVHGTNLTICDPCCEELPCQHIRPALTLARRINGGKS